MQIIGMLEAFPFTHNNSLQLPQNTKNKGIKQSPASVRLKESSSKRDQINNEDNQKEFSECYNHGYFGYDYDCNNYIENQKILLITMIFIFLLFGSIVWLIEHDIKLMT